MRHGTQADRQIRHPACTLQPRERTLSIHLQPRLAQRGRALQAARECVGRHLWRKHVNPAVEPRDGYVGLAHFGLQAGKADLALGGSLLELKPHTGFGNAGLRVVDRRDLSSLDALADRFGAAPCKVERGLGLTHALVGDQRVEVGGRHGAAKFDAARRDLRLRDGFGALGSVHARGALSAEVNRLRETDSGGARRTARVLHLHVECRIRPNVGLGASRRSGLTGMAGGRHLRVSFERCRDRLRQRQRGNRRLGSRRGGGRGDLRPRTAGQGE